MSQPELAAWRSHQHIQQPEQMSQETPVSATCIIAGWLGRRSEGAHQERLVKTTQLQAASSRERSVRNRQTEGAGQRASEETRDYVPW